jgi:uncharacterized protein with HEPN domain
MSKHDDFIRIRHMLDAANEVIGFTADVTFAEFEQDRMRHLAVVQQIEVIGEASKQVSASLKELHSEIDWRDIARSRDRLIHGYDTVILEIVWQICREELPKLILQLNTLLQSHGRAPE